LITICERILREFKFEIPSSPVKRFVVTKALVEEPEKELTKMLKNPSYSEEIYWAEQLKQKQPTKWWKRSPKIKWPWFLATKKMASIIKIFFSAT
jgi:hypothetical protein